MAKFEVKLPKMGESVAEATITSWLKSVGDSIELDEAIVEIATDKVDSEVPSEVEGTLVEILFEVDAVVNVGDTIAIIETLADEDSKEEVEVVEEENTESVQIIESEINEAIESKTISKVSSSGKFFSPLVRNIAITEGVSMEELESIVGTGKDERVTKNDILAYIEGGRNSQATIKEDVIPVSSPKKVAEKEVSKPVTPISVNGEDEIIEMSRMGKLIAHHMVESVQTSAHVQSFIEVDVTNIVKWRGKVKDAFLKREGEKLTFTPIFLEAMAKAIKDFPMINVSVDGSSIIKKKNINIGMAAALPSGNLIVPVIKNADEKNLVGLAKNVNDLANRSRANKLQPDEIQGSTITMTNLGGFGNITGTPIINQPNVAILAVGAIVKKPAVIETPEGDTIGIRHKMIMSLAYDHRVVDGALGGMFLKRVSDYLEQFDSKRLS